MSWNYRIIDHGDHLALHEVHYDVLGQPIAYAEAPATFVCDREEFSAGITKALDRALVDCRREWLTPADFPVLSLPTLRNNVRLSPQEDMMDSFSDEELAAELRRARHMGRIADAAGEADASALYASIQRACEFEQRERGINPE